ncbi:hypothetical protein HDU81_006463 [Chytriomyces hyalinus]|nr:hypothetical protein HDU81_006463 [Chytriomyces hyalinus]
MSILALLPMLFWVVLRRLLGSGASFVEVFMHSVRKYPNKEALVFTANDARFTYKELDNEVNKAANWMSKNGVAKGDVVAIMLNNSPEFIILWLASLKLGACVACVNPNLKAQFLLQSIETCNPRFLIVDPAVTSNVSGILSGINEETACFVVQTLVAQPLKDLHPRFKSMDFSKESTASPDMTACSNVCVNDVATLIYTSGTTGNPKAAILTHAKVCGGSALMGVAGLRHSDRIYTSLPLYHSTALILGFGTCISRGATLILSPKFSSTNFVSDCVRYNATAVQYIGELPRFLLNTRDSKNLESELRIRLAFGNGMRDKRVWREFQARFHIREIFEFYGSSEGNSNMYNLWKEGSEKGVGACGKLGPLVGLMQGVRLVKRREASSDGNGDEGVERNAHGYCTECKVGQVGELIAKIDDSSLTMAFKGYYGDADATRKKVLTNVFRKGDKYFQTGDLMFRDKDNYMYFVDRVGDTFRWNGENVSTQQVSDILSMYAGVDEANVYGVRVPGSEGRAGMAALSVSKDFDVKGLALFLNANLPKYAVPIWVRILVNNGSMRDSHTATFKQKKVVFQEQGFNTDAVGSDLLYWLKPGHSEYSEFGMADYSTVIMNGLPRALT